MSNLTSRINLIIKQIENVCSKFFGRYPPDAFCLSPINCPSTETVIPNPLLPSLKDLIGNGIFWAVPKHRTTIEKRWKRKYGSPQYKLKILVPKSNLRVCMQCGESHEVGVLCPTCYEKVKNETKQIQDQIQSALGLEPIEKDVIVLYDGEKVDKTTEFWQGKRIVELERPRPHWFSKNLLQKTTQQPATTKEIKPDDLG